MNRSFPEIIHVAAAAGWRRRFLIAIPVLLLPLLGFAVGHFAPRTYETQMTVMVQEPAKQSPYLGDLAVGTRLQERMPVLSSLVHHSSVLENVALDLGEITDETSRAERDAAVSRLSNGLSIKLIGSDLVELRLRGSSLARLDRELSQIGTRFIEKLTAPERSAIASSLKFLDEQIERRGPLLRQAEERLTDFRARNAASLPEVQSANVAHLGELRKLLEDRRAALAGATVLLSDLQASVAPVDPVGDELDKRIADLYTEIAQLKAKYTSRHPTLQALQLELQTLKEQRQKDIADGRTSSPQRRPTAAAEPVRAARAQQIALQVEVARLERGLAEAERAIASQADVQSELTTLKSALATEKEIYDKLVSRYELARVTGDLGTFEAADRVKIIAPPDQPAQVGPSASLFLIAGTVGGIALGLGLAVAAELADDSLRVASDIERVAGIPMLGRIPRLPPQAPAAENSDAGVRMIDSAEDLRFDPSLHPIKISAS